MYTGYRSIKWVAEFHKQRSVWRIGTTSLGEFPTTSLVHDTQEQLTKFDGARQWTKIYKSSTIKGIRQRSILARPGSRI